MVADWKAAGRFLGLHMVVSLCLDWSSADLPYIVIDGWALGRDELSQGCGGAVASL